MEDITVESVKAAAARLNASNSVDPSGILISQHYNLILGRSIFFVMENL